VGNTAVVLASPVLPPGFGVGSPLLGSTVQSIIGTAVTLAGGADTTITGNTAVSFEPGSGSVTIIGSGSRDAPLSAGGSLNIFASTITQGGVLRAPQGSITLGWDGTDFDPTTAAFDAPPNPVAGAAAAVPIPGRSFSRRAARPRSPGGRAPPAVRDADPLWVEHGWLVVD